MDKSALQDSSWRTPELHTLLVDAQDALDHGVVIAEGSRVVWANAAFARMTGYTREELSDRTFDLRRLEPKGGALEGRFAQERTTAKRRFEAKLVRKDGSRLVVAGSSTSVQHKGQTLRVSIVRDVTEKRRARRAVEESARALARAEKTASLHALIAALSHEVRTPLTIVSNAAALIEARATREGTPALVEALRPYLAMHEEGVRRAESIVADLASLTETSAKREQQAQSLHEVAEEALRVWRMAGKPCHVETDLRETPLVTLNRTQLHQAIIHLLRNAREACEPGEVRVRLSTRRAHDGAAMLIVEDEGAGIPADVKARMFEPLFTTREGHLGLGLTIVRAIVEAHEGAIRCESAPAQGTRFTLTLPAT